MDHMEESSETFGNLGMMDMLLFERHTMRIERAYTDTSQ